MIKACLMYKYIDISRYCDISSGARTWTILELINNINTWLTLTSCNNVMILNNRLNLCIFHMCG